jgi:DNA helicase II / ATP-dependent DNA helicase PcrA
MQLTNKQRQILESEGHLLVTGGPGSGKTTVSILKASSIAEKNLRSGQRVLFISFARASVSRVMEAIRYETTVAPATKRRIEVDTYHAFFWRILKTHGYLIGLPRSLSILTPPQVAIALSDLRGTFAGIPDPERLKREFDEKTRLAKEDGKVCFDLFADYAAEILQRSERIRKLVTTMYPYIVLDEFQDTNAGQWAVVRQLGREATLIALADPEQRIYDWIGADPERLAHFRRAFAITEIDLSNDNHRSPGTEIALFANHMLAGNFHAAPYERIEIQTYAGMGDQAFTSLVTATYRARGRLVQSGKRDWSLAVLVPTKKMVQDVVDRFRQPPAGMSEIHHTAVIEMDGPILAAHLLAFLMQPGNTAGHFQHFVKLLCEYFRGRGGDTLTKTDLETSQSISTAVLDLEARRKEGKALRANSRIAKTVAVYERAVAYELSGNPDKDWLAIRRLLADGDCARLRDVAADVRNVRLLERGSQLRQGLSEEWRNNGTYRNALTIVRQAFVQEHFSTTSRVENGVIVMNMHKAKGKAYDEVLIFEGWPIVFRRQVVANPDRIVPANRHANISEQSSQNFRVSITRARQKTLILTPALDPCVLLRSR